MIDKRCAEYENKIRSLGGIGFFLGGIGPDGHIAFNVRGSDHNSTTRLTSTNFETQASELNSTVTALNDEIKIKPMMYLALSYDHRIVDGKGAVTFLVRVKEALEDPRRLLMDL